MGTLQCGHLLEGVLVHTVLPWIEAVLTCWFKRVLAWTRKMLKMSGHWSERPAKSSRSSELSLTPVLALVTHCGSGEQWTPTPRCLRKETDSICIASQPCCTGVASGKWQEFFWIINSQWIVSYVTFFQGDLSNHLCSYQVRHQDQRNNSILSSLINQWVYWGYLQECGWLRGSWSSGKTTLAWVAWKPNPCGSLCNLQATPSNGVPWPSKVW